MHQKRTFLALLLACLTAALVVGPALAFPPLPSSFWGTVQVNGKNVPEGTLVRAMIGNIEAGQTHVMLYEGKSVFSLNVLGDDASTNVVEGGKEGDVIRFEVGGAPAVETALWHGGTNANQNLNVQAGSQLATPAPTSTPAPTQTTVTNQVQPPTQTPTTAATPAADPGAAPMETNAVPTPTRTAGVKVAQASTGQDSAPEIAAPEIAAPEMAMEPPAAPKMAEQPASSGAAVEQAALDTPGELPRAAGVVSVILAGLLASAVFALRAVKPRRREQ